MSDSYVEKLNGSGIHCLKAHKQPGQSQIWNSSWVNQQDSYVSTRQNISVTMGGGRGSHSKKVVELKYVISWWYSHVIYECVRETAVCTTEFPLFLSYSTYSLVLCVSFFSLLLDSKMLYGRAHILALLNV